MTTCFCLTDYGNFVIGHKGAEGARGADGPRGNQHNWSMHSAKLNLRWNSMSQCGAVAMPTITNGERSNGNPK